jgi:hypothetical protein
MKTIAILAVALFSAPLLANPPALVDRQAGEYLGDLGGNRYNPNSTDNPYGQYGSRYSGDSINNPYGKRGSKYSGDSPNNPYASSPPAIVVPGGAGIVVPQGTGIEWR